MRFLGRLLRFALILYARVVLIGAGFSACIAAWAYYGYRRIGCHPMFSGSTGVECGSVQALAAEHAMSIVRTIAPFQEDILENRDQLLLFSAALVGFAILIEVVFALATIILQHGNKKPPKRSRHVYGRSNRKLFY
jgi:hypothetical protein